jgi:hypothetical protein
MTQRQETQFAVENLRSGGVLHVRFDGRVFDVSLPGAGLEADSPDDQVKFALAEFLEVPTYRLDEYVVDRHDNGSLTLRMESVLW